MEILTGKPDALAPGVFQGLAEYRYKIFVEKLGWRLSTRGSIEVDQFDREDTIYLVARDGDGNIVGTARLLSTERPYLLGEIFPQLIPGVPPCAHDVWELSRFAVSGDDSRTTGPLSQFDSKKVVVLLRAALALAANVGARKVITVSPLGIERLLRRYGFSAYRAGPPRIINGYPTVACWIDTTEVGDIGKSPVLSKTY